MDYMLVLMGADAIITLFAYGLGPILLICFRNKPMKRSHIRLFAILYTVVIAFLFYLFRLSFAEEPVRHNAAPAFIWGTAFYCLMVKKLCPKPQKEHEATATQPPAEDISNYTPSPEIQTRREGSHTALIIAVSFLAITTVILGGSTLYLLGERSDVQGEREELLSEVEELRTRNNSLQKQYNQAVTQLGKRREQIEELQRKDKGKEVYEYFARVRTGIIIGDIPKIYHSPDCEELVGHEGDIEVYTSTVLFDKGYNPCEKCHTTEEMADILFG